MKTMTDTNSTVIMASLTDPDDGEANPMWVWEVSEIRQVDLDIDNPDHWGSCAWNRK